MIWVWFMNGAKIFTALTFLLISAVCAAAQGNQYPNELKGFEFFGKGKLRELRLTVSSKDDVIKIFGKKCQKKCDYDAAWSVRFEYYEDVWIKEHRDEKGEKLRYLLNSKYLGKLRSIEIRPKKRLSFADVAFPDIFQKLLTTSTTDTRSGRSKMTAGESFQDSDGLKYEIYSRTNYDDISSGKEKSLNNDLILIRYDISEKFEKTLFILQINNRKTFI